MSNLLLLKENLCALKIQIPDVWTVLSSLNQLQFRAAFQIEVNFWPLPVGPNTHTCTRAHGMECGWLIARKSLLMLI